MPKLTAGPRAPGDRDEQTVQLARKRFARRQWARRWLVWRRILAALLVLAAVVGAVWLVLFSSVLAVTTVEVEGNEVLGSRQVRRVAAVPIGDPLATVNLGAVAARVEGLAPVKSVDVSRSWPHSVRIAVEERVAVAVVEREGRVTGLDDEGVLFRSFPSVPDDLPLVRMGNTTKAEALAEAAAVVDALPDALAERVDHVEVDTIDTISLRLRNGDTVFWGSADDSRSKAEVLEVLLRHKARTYDVSVPSQPTITR